jgi:beta-glucosidase/6-phospho-beta-glucosidase/beta-galactosidase
MPVIETAELCTNLDSALSRVRHYGGFESTKLPGEHLDILGTTRHIERWRADLELLLDSGIRDLRYSAPWHRIGLRPDALDFSWMDGPMGFMRRSGMDPILDPLHHVSFPDWLTLGLADPRLPEAYCSFAVQLARRYEWVGRYTVINEPLPTSIMSAFSGIWPPYLKSDDDFVRTVLNVSRTICETTAALRRERSDIEFVHIDTCEWHMPLDEKSEAWADHANARRFLIHDLVLGRVDRAHELYEYLRSHGAQEDDLLWFADHPAVIHVLGLDYYSHCEMDWYYDEALGRPNIAWPVSNPRGFASVATDYVKRYGLPVMLSETNLRGTIGDRLTWLKFMEEQYECLAQTGADLRGFCWYPSIDSTDWNNLCTKGSCDIDPQGIWSIGDTRWERIETELSIAYRKLASGEWSAADIPAHPFHAPWDKDLSGYVKLMRET